MPRYPNTPEGDLARKAARQETRRKARAKWVANHPEKAAEVALKANKNTGRNLKLKLVAWLNSSAIWLLRKAMHLVRLGLTLLPVEHLKMLPERRGITKTLTLGCVIYSERASTLL